MKRTIQITSCCKIEVEEPFPHEGHHEHNHIIPIYTPYFNRGEVMTSSYFYVCPSCKKPCAVTEKEKK